MISPGRLWWLLRRDLKRGWEASYYDYKVLPLIRQWSWHVANDVPQSIPVHVLTGRNDWRLAAWMLASWFHFSEHSWPIYIHDDGTLPEEARSTLHKLFPAALFVSRKQADARMNRFLQAYPYCHDYRNLHPLGLKIFDIPHLTPGKRFLVFDSDLLFFNHPRELLDHIASDDEGCWFNEDIREGSLITAAEARSKLGIDLAPRKQWPLSPRQRRHRSRPV